MKTLNLALDDEDFERVKLRKGKQTWRAYLLNPGPEQLFSEATKGKRRKTARSSKGKGSKKHHPQTHKSRHKRHTPSRPAVPMKGKSRHKRHTPSRPAVPMKGLEQQWKAAENPPPVVT